MSTKIFSIIGLIIMFFSAPCFAQEKVFKVEVLQITALEEIQKIYDGFVRDMEKDGFVQGKNLIIKRTIIDFDVENESWSSKIKVYWRIRGESARIAKEKPDLVVTMGTPVTKYAKDKIISAGIPLVFTASAYPAKIGCKSLTEAGPGFTGVLTYMDLKEALRIVKAAFPEIKTMGVVYSEYPNSFDPEEAVKAGSSLNLGILTRHVNMKDRITPALKELQKHGAQILAVPPDPYYAIKNYEAANELTEFSKAAKLPVINFAIDKVRGSILDVGVDYETIGSLTGRQAVKILKEGAKPGSLPILRQQNLTVLVNMKALKALGIQPSSEILQMARPVE